MLTTVTCADRYTRAVTAIVIALALTLAVGCARQLSRRLAPSLMAATFRSLVATW